MSPRLPPRIETIEVGATAECSLAVGPEEIAAYAALSGDDNALHLDRDTALACGFPDRVAHGMISLGAISRLIGTALPGHGSLWMSQDLQFSRPVIVGDRLTARVTVERVSAAAGVVILRTEVEKAGTGEKILSGTAKVRVVRPATPALESPA